MQLLGEKHNFSPEPHLIIRAKDVVSQHVIANTPLDYHMEFHTINL